MSRLVSRILLTVLLFPSATLVLFLSFVFLERLMFRRDIDAAVYATLLTCGYMAAYWMLLWYRAVSWSTERVGRTLKMSITATLAGVVMGAAVASVLPNEKELGTCAGALTAAVVWIILTIFAWRESSAERAQRLARAGADTVVCPSCGYNLTGLREARCPECGTSFTLNELLASQPARAAVEVDQD